VSAVADTQPRLKVVLVGGEGPIRDRIQRVLAPYGLDIEWHLELNDIRRRQIPSSADLVVVLTNRTASTEQAVAACRIARLPLLRARDNATDIRRALAQQGRTPIEQENDMAQKPSYEPPVEGTPRRPTSAGPKLVAPPAAPEAEDEVVAAVRLLQEAMRKRPEVIEVIVRKDKASVRKQVIQEEDLL
jgi:hypothetical protein